MVGMEYELIKEQIPRPSFMPVYVPIASKGKDRLSEAPCTICQMKLDAKSMAKGKGGDIVRKKGTRVRCRRLGDHPKNGALAYCVTAKWCNRGETRGGWQMRLGGK